jgi:ankyrin repeat protein
MNLEAVDLFLAAVAKETPTEVYRLIRDLKLEPHLVRDAKGHSALHVALLNNNTEVVCMLFSHVPSS